VISAAVASRDRDDDWWWMCCLADLRLLVELWHDVMCVDSDAITIDALCAPGGADLSEVNWVWLS